MTELEAWLKLWHIPKVGPRTFNFLLGKFPQLEPIFHLNADDLTRSGVPKHIARAISHHSSQRHLDDIAWLNAHENHHITLINQAAYPDILKQIHDPPPILYSIGKLEQLTAPLMLAIVGSRRASASGKKLAYQIAHECAELGIVIVSGLALGIDAQAHCGALDANEQSTVAVLANGPDRIYPPAHRALTARIAQQSVLVSEFPPGVHPLAQHFPRRNRIISGLSLGTLVIEAAAKSGSLITARYALEQGREIFALPGPVNNPQFQGCHDLIQQGAKLVTGVTDILSELAPMVEIGPVVCQGTCLNSQQPASPEHSRLLDSIDYTPESIESIIAKSGLTPERVSSMLTELEIGGLVAADNFGQYSRL